MSEPSVCSSCSHLSPRFLHYLSHRNILAGSYDSNVRIFDASQKPLHTVTGHTAPVTSVCWVGEERIIASASHDRTVRLVRVPEVHDGAPTTLASLHLHTAPVSSVVSDRQGMRLLTASWDTFIGVWSTSIPEADEVAMEHTTEDRKKRRRVAEEVRTVRKVCRHALSRSLVELIHLVGT
jgi:ribosome biogenesis protein